jgi:hypothetical protein
MININEYLLQTVDDWGRRTVRILNNDEEIRDAQVT